MEVLELDQVDDVGRRRCRGRPRDWPGASDPQPGQRNRVDVVPLAGSRAATGCQDNDPAERRGRTSVVIANVVSLRVAVEP